MKKYITDVLTQLHKTVTTDAYGQIHKSNFVPSVFGENKDAVQKYCKENLGILEFSTYGGRLGTYTAFNIVDLEIRSACITALKSNPNYLKNINSF